MRFTIDAHWNGKPVISGSCTGVLAWEVARLLAANFVGPTVGPVPTLIDIVNAEQGTVLAWSHADETGSAAVRIRVVSL